jgi:hypothetical protein
MWRFALHKSARRYLEHDPEKGEPISRLREALRHASAGEGRPEKIMLQEEVGV